MNRIALVKSVVVVFIAILIVLYFWPLRTVPTGTRGVITVGGAIKGIEPEGFLLIWPWQSLSIFSIRAEAADIENAEGATSDTQPVHVSMTVRYSIAPDKVAEVFERYSHDGNLASYVQTATQEIFKAVTARYTAVELIAQRAKVSGDIGSSLREKLAVYGAQVINIDIRNFAFSDSYMAAINAKVTQEQLRLGAENKLLTVAAEQKQKVAIAEAEASAIKATADGEAYRVKTEAAAWAYQLKVKSDALAQSNSGNILELKRIEVDLAKAEKWDGKLPEAIYAGAPIPFLAIK